MSGDLRAALEEALTTVEEGIAHSTRPEREGFLMTSHIRQILAAHPAEPAPLLDRDALLVEMGRPDGAHNMRSPEGRAYAYEMLYGKHADAALKLAQPVPTAEQIAMKLSLVRFTDEQSDRMIELTMREAWPLADAVRDMLGGDAK